MHKIKIPHLGEGIEKVKIAFLHVKKGDKIKKDDELIEVTTDKASFSIESEYDGIVCDILVKQGQDVLVGDVVLKLQG